MIPREANRGSSFKGAGLYYLHDKDAQTRERVAFTHTENIPTDDPDKAIKWMTWTASNANKLKQESGVRVTKPCTKPVYTLSIAWHPDTEPDKEHMIQSGRSVLAALGLSRHETLMVSHRDRDHAHLHLIVNVVDPETGRAHTMKKSKLKLSAWAEEYEKSHGKIYCNKRVENNERRKKGEYVEYEEKEHDLKSLIGKLYHASDNGRAFEAALKERGYSLASGKRILIVDADGKTHSLSRQLDGVRAKDIRAKLADLRLKEAEGLKKWDSQKNSGDSRKNKPSPDDDYVDRDAQDQKWQESIIDAGIKHGQSQQQPRNDRAAKARGQKAGGPAAASYPSPENINAVQSKHLAELGDFYDRNERRRLSLSARLDEYYGESAQTLKSRIGKLEGQLKDAGTAKLWWMKFTGKIGRHAERDLENMRLTLADIERRKAEQVGALNNRIEKERAAIALRQERERRAVEAYYQASASKTHIDLAPRRQTSEESIAESMSELLKSAGIDTEKKNEKTKNNNNLRKTSPNDEGHNTNNNYGPRKLL